MKTKTLHVNIMANLEVDFSDAELEARGKTFREFKLGVERVVRDQLLPVFQADAHSRVQLGTISFPSAKKMKVAKSKTHSLIKETK